MDIGGTIAPQIMNNEDMTQSLVSVTILCSTDGCWRITSFLRPLKCVVEIVYRPERIRTPHSVVSVSLSTYNSFLLPTHELAY